MKIIADSGSTKTKFALVEGGAVKYVLTAGINPYYQSGEDIESTLRTQLLPEVAKPESVRSIEFYGAGCGPADKIAIVRDALQAIFLGSTIIVASDLLGAAKALCGEEAGIACILGTGSNSCYYDGEKIVQNVSPLGFILGDEGSGAVLGKLLVADILKNQAPKSLADKFFRKYNYTSAEIIDKVYRKPFPNRFLASLAPFISENIDDAYCHSLVYNSFKAFIDRNLRQYPAGLPVHFTGSVAYYFRAILEDAMTASGLKLGRIVREPIELLIS